MDSISRGELVAQGEQKDIRITTSKFEIYEFKSFNYTVKSDTLYGTGEKIIDKHNSIPFSGKIALKDIEFVEENKFDIGTTCLTLVGASLVITLIVFMMALHEFGESLKRMQRKRLKFYNLRHICLFQYLNRRDCPYL